MTHPTWVRLVALTVTIAVWTMVGATAAQHEGRDHTSVAGRWTISVNGPHAFSMGLTLEQDGSKVTGTLANPHGGGQFPVAGTLEGRTLALSVTSGSDMELAGELKDDGTMTGSLSSGRGDAEWTAKRAQP